MNNMTLYDFVIRCKKDYEHKDYQPELWICIHYNGAWSFPLKWPLDKIMEHFDLKSFNIKSINFSALFPHKDFPSGYIGIHCICEKRELKKC